MTKKLKLKRYLLLGMSLLTVCITLSLTNQSVLAVEVYEDTNTGQTVEIIKETTEVLEEETVESVFTIPTYTNTEVNTYYFGQCTWGVKVLAPWVGDYWGNAADWVSSAQAAGYEIGTTPKQGAIAVWLDGGYGHVAYVIEAQSETAIQVLESNYAGNMAIANYRGIFDPTAPMWGQVVYIYPNT